MINTLYLPELREMLAAQDEAGLAEFCTTLHPASTADYMQGLTAEETWAVLQHTDLATRVEIFLYLGIEKQVEMIETLDRNAMASFIGELPPDERVDILQEVEPDIVEELLPLIPAVERRDIIKLQAYEEGTAGAMMTTEFARLRADMTLEDVREQFRHWAETPNAMETLYYLYVVDSKNVLLGVISFRELMLATITTDTNEQRLGELLKGQAISVQADQDQEQVAQVFARYDLLALPVVNSKGQLLGIVTHDDVIDVIREEATEDAQRVGGMEPLEGSYLKVGLLSLAWKRGIWLTILFFTSLFTAGALEGYTNVTQAHVWLVMFIPMIISTGGNSGNQSATLVITAMTNGEVRLQDWWRVFLRELAMGLVLGGALGICGFFIAMATTHTLLEATVIPCTVLLVVICGTFLGSALPLLFRWLGLDPALMSNPLVACLSDILGIVIYMSVALTLLGV